MVPGQLCVYLNHVIYIYIYIYIFSYILVRVLSSAAQCLSCAVLNPPTSHLHFNSVWNTRFLELTSVVWRLCVLYLNSELGSCIIGLSCCFLVFLGKYPARIENTSRRIMNQHLVTHIYIYIYIYVFAPTHISTVVR